MLGFFADVMHLVGPRDMHPVDPRVDPRVMHPSDPRVDPRVMHPSGLRIMHPRNCHPE